MPGCSSGTGSSARQRQESTSSNGSWQVVTDTGSIDSMFNGSYMMRFINQQQQQQQQQLQSSQPQAQQTVSQTQHQHQQHHHHAYKPVSMKLFAAWEVDRTPSNCVPR